MKIRTCFTMDILSYELNFLTRCRMKYIDVMYYCYSICVKQIWGGCNVGWFVFNVILYFFVEWLDLYCQLEEEEDIY
jgi:hypothetical protein